MVVGGQRVGYALQDHGLAGLGRGDYQRALALADGRDQVYDARGHIGLGRLQEKAPVGVQRRQVVEKRPVAYLLYLFAVDGLHLEQREEPFAFLRGPDQAGDGVALAQAELLYLGRRDIYIFMA